MSLSSRYQITDTLHESTSTVVYRGFRLSDERPVIIKSLPSVAKDEHKAAQFVNEQLLLAQLNHPHISNIIDMATTPLEYFHVFEDIGGDSLYNLLIGHSFSLEEGLYIALAVAKTVQYLHEQHVIHADLNPKNIIYNLESRALRVIDFGYSVQDNQFLFNNDIHAGTSGNFLYMSPEQTGRTKKKIDYRTDFYSLGMTLYHLFAGRLPFTAKDRYELIHKQVAITLPSLCSINPDFPLSLSLMIDKLIEKNPQKRYQSDASIVHDLEHCLRMLQLTGSISHFEIASYDRPNVQVGDRLIGREAELNVVKQVLQQAKLNQTALRIIVSGASGIGKTRFIEECLSLFKESHARILMAKADQYKNNVPYLIMRQIFIQLQTLLMSQRLAKHKIDISHHSAQLLAYVFDELAPILNYTESVKLSFEADDVTAQLPYAISELLEAIANSEMPLVLMIDDLQWLDSASLYLIKKGILEQKNKYVHLVLSFRDQEIQSNPYALTLVNQLKLIDDFGTACFQLYPLTFEAINELLTDLFHAQPNDLQLLTALVEKKTNGNPFYIRTFIDHLLSEQYIYFDHGEWLINLEKISVASANINVAEIIIRKIETVTVEERLYLKYLAILGSRFNLTLMTELMSSVHSHPHILSSLDAKGFIEIHGHEYHFVHDQIRQHVKLMISEDESCTIHANIGLFLWLAYRSSAYNDLVTLVQHLNAGRNKTKLSKRQLLSLNLKALALLIQNNTYEIAFEQLKWVEDSFESILLEGKADFNELKARILYLTAHHELAYQQTKTLLSMTNRIDDKLRYFALLKNICVTRGEQFQSLLGYGNNLLRELGVTAPDSVTSLAQEVDSLAIAIRHHRLYASPEQVLSHKVLASVSKQRILALLVNYWEAAYYLADIELMRWSYLTIIHYSLRYGNCSYSTFGYVLFGAELIAEGDYQKGFLFGEVALKLNHHLDDRSMLPKIHNFFANFINPYVKHFRSNVPIYQKSLLQSKMNGDIVFGTWANFLMHLSDYFSGTHLDTLRQRMRDDSQFLLNSGDQKMIAIFNVLNNTVTQLQQGVTETRRLEQEAVMLWEREGFLPGLAWYGIIKAQSCLLLNSPDQAYAYLKQYVRHEANAVIFFPKIRLHFLRALILLSMRQQLSDEDRHLLELDLHICRDLSKASPKMFTVSARLLKAEESASINQTWLTAKAFDDAIGAARKQGNPFYIALANLCAKRYWKKQHYADVAQSYLSQAVMALNQWGAYDLAKRLGRTQPIEKYSSSNLVTSYDSSNTSINRLSSINFKNLISSLYAISQSFDKHAIVKQLMQSILENAGANRALLVLNENDRFYISASSDFLNERFELLHVALDEATELPISILNYAINTGKKVIANSPAETGKFQFDTYFKAKKPASSVAIPSLLEGVVRSVLYLENESIVVPLAQEDLKTLEILLTQATIVLKNAFLYETLKRNEEKLNKAQQVAHVGSWDYNWVTNMLVWSAETYRIFDLNPFSIEVDYDWFLQHVHPEDRDIVITRFEEARNGSRQYACMHRIITASGAVKTVQQRAEVYWEDGVQKASGITQDITETKRNEAMIAKLSRVVYQSPFSTMITDPLGNIEYVNARTLKITGYFEHELIGNNMHLFNSGSHRSEFFKNLWHTISNKKEIWRGLIINRMKNGELCDFDSTIFPIINSENEITNFVAIQEDVTERNVKDRLFLMQTRQAQMGEMLAMIAHQWRQPLAIISAIINKQRVDVMLNKATNESSDNTLDNIEHQVQYLSRTITDFKDFFKPDKLPTLTRSSIIVNKALSLMQHMLKNHGVNVEVVHQEDNEYSTYEHELVQVLLNLIKNAQDAFIERSTVNPHIVIRTSQIADEVTITVDDNAGGIDDKVIDTLFLPYVSTKDAHNGTGLGLYMSKSIIEEHCHGHIHAINTVVGAQFKINLPLAKVLV